jgi:hypothetical protein
MSSFWDEHRAAESDPSRWLYITAEQRLSMLESGNPFDVTGVMQGSGRYGLEWQATLAAGDAVKVLSLRAGYEGRDHKLAAMQAWFGEHPFGTIRCRLALKGRMHDLVDGREGSEKPEPVEFMDWTNA